MRDFTDGARSTRRVPVLLPVPLWCVRVAGRRGLHDVRGASALGAARRARVRRRREAAVDGAARRRRRLPAGGVQRVGVAGQHRRGGRAGRRVAAEREAVCAVEVRLRDLKLAQ